LNKIILGNCLDVMEEMVEVVDLCIVDPPYKLNHTTGSKTSSSKRDRWQGNLFSGDKTANIENSITFYEWMPLVYKTMKPQSHFYVFVNDKNVHMAIDAAIKAKFKLHNILIWKKNNKTPNRWYMKNAEFILFFRKGKSKPINNLSSPQVMECKNIQGKNKLHPTEKPVSLLKELILNSSNEGDLVCDFFAGSSSTLVAAKETGRQFLGVEIDQKYYDISKDRIS
jgi:site-specific DNA-methyltransferase (adenine-specific)